MLSMLRAFGDALDPSVCDPNFDGPLSPAQTTYCQQLPLQNTQAGNAAAIANAMTAGAGIFTLPQQKQALQLLQAQTTAQAQAKQQADMLALLAANKTTPSAIPSWAIYAGVGAVVLILVMAMASRR